MTSAASAGPARGFDDRCGAVRALGQAITVSGLYQALHPVTQRAVEEVRVLLEKAVAEERPLVLGLGPSGWLVDGETLPRSIAVPDALAGLFQRRSIQALAFWRGVQSPEIAALCELAAQPEAADPGETQAFLDRRGVRRVTIGRDRPDQAPPPAPPRPSNAHPFSDFLKRLVERSARDPREQAKLYEEALSLVRSGMREMLDGQIASAQAQLESQARQLLQDAQRTQRVLATVAEGRVTVDPEGRVLMMNPTAEQIAGKSLSQVAGKPLAESVAGQGQVLAMAAPGDADPSAPVLVRGAEEAYEAFRRSVALVCDPEGRVVGTYGVLPHAAKAQEMARMQEDFVSRVTHELKAPLTAIAAAVDMLKERVGTGLAEEDQSLLEMSQRNVGRLRRMIDDLLDFASLESGAVQIRPQPCDPMDLVDEASGALKPWAESKGIRLSMVPNSNPLPKIQADAQRVIQVLTNLLSNAIKATPAGGCVDCGVVSEGKFARFWVRDTGCGIAREDQRRIFEKFVQLQANGGKREGVGLGLAIVVDLVARHGGTIALESEPGKGALFSFTIPFAA